MGLRWWILSSVALITLLPMLIGFYDSEAFEISDEATLSRISQRTAWKYPPYQWFLCFLLAELCGHLFTTKAEARPLADWLSLFLLVGIPYLIVVVCLVLGVHRCKELPTSGPSCFVPLVISLLLGVTSGAYLLHQTGS